MKAISTKILLATNTKPKRLKAFDCDGNSVIISEGEVSGSLHSEDTNKFLAQKLADKMGWPGELVGGWTKEGYVFVFLPG
jgi:hypothetical protein